MADRSVVVKLIANVSDYRRNLKLAADDATKFSAKNKQNMETVGKAGLAMGTGLALGVGLALKRFADFDQAMSNIKAATHESAAAMTQLREAALEAGARTAFSAVQAAEGIEALAKAGVSTTAILNGGLNGALDLAAAGGLEVGAAAEIAATALTQFRLEGAQVPHVADLLAAAAGKAQGDVSDMGMALKQAGLVASQTGLSIEETTAGLAAFASAGLLGSDAGTSFKSMLQRLTPQSEEAAGEMERLGISAYDAQGNFIGLEQFAGNLQESLAGLTVEQRNSAMATIFGSDAVRAASVLYSQGAEGVADWTEKVNDAGYAQETAATRLDNLKGDIEAFMGSVETAMIRTGEAGDGLARSAVQSATGVVNAYNELPGAAQSAVLAVGGVSGAASLAAGGFLLLAPRILETRKALTELSTEMPKTTAAMSALGKAAGIAGVIVGTALAVDALVTALADAPAGTGALTDGLADFLRTGAATGETARLLGTDLRNLQSVMEEASKTKYLDLNTFSGGVTGIEEARQALEALDQTLAGMVSAGHGVEAARIVLQTGISSQDAVKHLDAYTDAQASSSGQSKLAADAQGELGGAVVDATGAVVAQTESLSDLMEKVKGISDLILGLRGDERSFQAAVDDATKSLQENGRTLDINTEKGRANEAALDAIASSAGSVLQSMADADKPVSDITAKFEQQRTALINAAEGFGMTTAEAERYADSVLRIPDKKTTAIALTGIDAALSQVDRLRQYLAGLTNKTVTVRVDEVLGVTVGRGPGRLTERASGGILPGPPSSVDNMLIAAATGEYVVNARQTARHLPLLEAINSGRLPGFATGGYVRAEDGSLVSRAFYSDRMGRPKGDPNYGADVTSGSLMDSAKRLSTVEQVRALVKAWEEFNDQLAQAARRQELFDDLAQASADRAVASNDKDRVRTQKALDEARARLAEFDEQARLDSERKAVERLVERMEAEAQAREDAARAAEKLAEARRDALEAAKREADDALTYLDRLLDQEKSVRDRQAQAQADFGDTSAQIQARQVQAEAEFYARRAALGREFNDEQARILSERRDALAGWARLDTVASPAWGNTVGQLIGNAHSQLDQFREWMDALADARARGVSEDVIAALGLDQGPQALGQLRQFNAATVGEIDALNRAVQTRTSLAGEQVSREQQNRYGALGRELLAAQQRYAQELDALQQQFVDEQAELAEQLTQAQAELLAEQAELALELAAIGAEQGRSYGQAIAEAMRSQIPAVLAAAEALKQAQAGLAEASRPAPGQGTGRHSGIDRARERTLNVNPTPVVENHTYVVLDGKVIDSRVSRTLGRQRLAAEIAGTR